MEEDNTEEDNMEEDDAKEDDAEEDDAENGGNKQEDTRTRGEMTRQEQRRRDRSRAGWLCSSPFFLFLNYCMYIHTNPRKIYLFHYNTCVMSFEMKLWSFI